MENLQKGTDTILLYINWCQIKGLKPCRVESILLYSQYKKTLEVQHA